MSYLVATDGSTEGDEAVRYAARQAVAFYETLEIVHVLTPESELVDGTIVLPGEEAAVASGEDVLDNARAVAEAAVGDEPID
ncbi:universal stress protein, partial [Halorubrum sp. SD626R]|uniref:universal stress protein n=2 Tax=Halorubrum TaxID=56688 RepID=UPI001137B1B6